jgi:hypothetical protein
MKDGKPVYVNQQEALGQEPYSPMQRAEAPALIQEYNLYTEQEKAAGRVPEPYMTWLPRNAAAKAQAPYQMGQAGGATVAFDRRNASTTQLTSAEEEVAAAAQKAASTTAAETTAKAKSESAIDLPRVKQNTGIAIDALKQLKSHKGLSTITGLYSLAPVVPGTDQAAADALAKQIEGKVFLEAFNTLKGGGVITETEGTKATAAIGRLQRSQSTEDYKAAIDDLVSVLENGVKLAEKKAGEQSQGQKKRVKVDINGDVIQ